uniref:Nucleoporin NUP42 n=1 Tax=Podarcis muralis TaxID=64176 RepID=A0A670JVW9_PODMU
MTYSVCHYFLQGHCRFGDNCWNEHPRQHAGRANAGKNGRMSRSASPPAASLRSGRRVAWSGHNQRYSNPVQTSSFSKSTSWHNRDSGFSQNRYAALNSTENVGNSGIVDEEDKLLEIIMKDMESWESSGQWMFSTYSPMKEKPNISGFPDFLPEELRLEYYNSRANNNVQNYINSVQQLASQWRSRLLELKNINASTKAALVSVIEKMKRSSFKVSNLFCKVCKSFSHVSEIIVMVMYRIFRPIGRTFPPPKMKGKCVCILWGECRLSLKPGEPHRQPHKLGGQRGGGTPPSRCLPTWFGGWRRGDACFSPPPAPQAWGTAGRRSAPSHCLPTWFGGWRRASPSPSPACSQSGLRAALRKLWEPSATSRWLPRLAESCLFGGLGWGKLGLLPPQPHAWGGGDKKILYPPPKKNLDASYGPVRPIGQKIR